MGVTIDIKKQEHVFIDGATGERLTREQFAQRAKGIKLGISGVAIQPQGLREAVEEDKGQEDL